MIDRGYIWRTTLVVVALLLVWGGLAARLGFLHLGANERLKAQVRKMRTVEEEILVGRGRILDRNGQLLALDLPVKNIIVEPKVVLSNGQARAVSAQLARVLGLPVGEVYACPFLLAPEFSAGNVRQPGGFTFERIRLASRVPFG